MTPAEKRNALSDEIAYYRRCIPGRHAAQESARRIVRALENYPVMHDQIPYDVLGMVRREAKNLPPVE